MNASRILCCLASLLAVAINAVGCRNADHMQPPARSDTSNPSSDRQDGKLLLDLETIGTGFQKFHNAHGAMPAAAIVSPDGQPLLSWRVALLPYLDEMKLYQQFKLSEPWDSEHNRTLLSKMPSVYRPKRGRGDGRPGATHYQVFTGAAAPFSPEAGMSIRNDGKPEGKLGPKLTEVTDGASQTFLVVEAGEPVEWTRPGDLVYEAGKPLPDLGVDDRFYLVLMDGSAHFLKNSVADDIIRGGITPRGQQGTEGRYAEPVLYSDARFVLDKE